LKRLGILGFVVGTALLACGEDDDSARSWDPATSSGEKCARQTCESLAKTCGTHDDGCGGTLDCGTPCVDGACEPKSCEQLGKACGRHDDTCGGMVDCGPCKTCQADSRESNDVPDRATDLGELSDSPNSTKTITGLSAGEGDEDWFQFSVVDGGFGGNPLVKAAVSGSGLEVSVFYLCSSEANYSSCPVEGEIPDATKGVGCRGRGTATVYTDCSWWNESGKAYVRVRKVGTSDGAQCLSYALTITVT
jgi:hypothetical protein